MSQEHEITFVGCECIVRDGDVYSIKSHMPWLHFVGQSRGFAACVERCNEGTATEADLLCLSALPVFDADVPSVPEIIIL